MKSRLVPTLSILAAILIAAPCFAQANTGFYRDLKAGLGSTSTGEAPVVVGNSNGRTAPPAPANAIPLGTADHAASPTAAAPPQDATAYVAGTDIWSGPIAGVAAILSVVLIGLVIWLLLGHRKRAGE
jgi:hypothetical protein